MIDFDHRLPDFIVYDTTMDDLAMAIGDSQLEGIEDREAIVVLRKLRRVYDSRLKEIDRELSRLEDLNAPTDFTHAELDQQMARTKRWVEQDFPRLLEIALHENGIAAK